MKYFLVKTDPQFDTAPEIIDWFKRIDRRNIRLGKSYEIENRQLFFIKGNPQTVFPDVLSFPFFYGNRGSAGRDPDVRTAYDF